MVVARANLFGKTAQNLHKCETKLADVYNMQNQVHRIADLMKRKQNCAGTIYVSQMMCALFYHFDIATQHALPSWVLCTASDDRARTFVHFVRFCGCTGVYVYVSILNGGRWATPRRHLAKIG